MTMDCGTAHGKINAKADGLLPRQEEAELADHLAGCPACAADDAAIVATGPALRALTGIRAMEKTPALDAMWTRVRAGIEEGRETRRRSSRIARWAWIPAAIALAASALLFYPARTNRSPFHPTSFDVAVEDVESDTATVALINKGEDLPRVIWIIEDAKT
jgi:anti-sigma factor RsiW